MRSGGVADKPLWDTETGWSGPKPLPSEELGAAYLARTYVLSWAAGVERVYWYLWDNPGEVALQTTGRSYDVVVRWLAGATMKECSEDGAHTWTCAIGREGASQWVVWNAEGDRNFAVPAEWRATTVQPLSGGARGITASSMEVGQVPVLVSGK